MIEFATVAGLAALYAFELFWLMRRGRPIDMVEVLLALGACTRPPKGLMAYRLVAMDVLGYMVGAGRLVRTGNGDPRHPENDGFEWDLSR
jgi:hypothetical protein